MTGVGVALAAIGLSDLVAGGLAGEPAGRRRTLVGLAAAAAMLAAGGALGGLGVGGWLQVTLLTLPALAAWSGLRYRRPLTSRRAMWATGVLATLVLVLLAAGAAWQAGERTDTARWLERLPYPGLAGLEVGRFFMLAGIGIFLVATSNGVVRTVLAAAGTEVTRSEQRLRGGRLIGVIERWLIFGLALAGEPTAATLVISAKSILRFPQLSKAARETTGDQAEGPIADVDVVTEYFLLGSLVSWALALAPAVLLGR